MIGHIVCYQDKPFWAGNWGDWTVSNFEIEEIEREE